MMNRRHQVVPDDDSSQRTLIFRLERRAWKSPGTPCCPSQGEQFRPRETVNFKTTNSNSLRIHSLGIESPFVR
jgi:hypothetical protein